MREQDNDITFDASHFIRINLLTIGGAIFLTAGVFWAYVAKVESKIDQYEETTKEYRDNHRVEITAILKRKASIEQAQDRYTNAQAKERDNANKFEHETLKEVIDTRAKTVDRELDRVHNDISELRKELSKKVE